MKTIYGSPLVVAAFIAMTFATALPSSGEEAESAARLFRVSLAALDGGQAGGYQLPASLQTVFAIERNSITDGRILSRVTESTGMVGGKRFFRWDNEYQRPERAPITIRVLTLSDGETVVKYYPRTDSKGWREEPASLSSEPLNTLPEILRTLRYYMNNPGMYRVHCEYLPIQPEAEAIVTLGIQVTADAGVMSYEYTMFMDKKLPQKVYAEFSGLTVEFADWQVHAGLLIPGLVEMSSPDNDGRGNRINDANRAKIRLVTVTTDPDFAPGYFSAPTVFSER